MRCCSTDNTQHRRQSGNSNNFSHISISHYTTASFKAYRDCKCVKYWKCKDIILQLGLCAVDLLSQKRRKRQESKWYFMLHAQYTFKMFLSEKQNISNAYLLAYEFIYSMCCTMAFHKSGWLNFCDNDQQRIQGATSQQICSTWKLETETWHVLLRKLKMSHHCKEHLCPLMLMNVVTGDYCEVSIDECMSSPCLHNATCIDLAHGYECVCIPGFAGL